MSRIEKVEEELIIQASKEITELIGKTWSLETDPNTGMWDVVNGKTIIGFGETELQAVKTALSSLRDTQCQKMEEYEIVDHPQHYGGASARHEAISVIEEWGLGFHLGNVVKYISRAGKKPDQTTLSDLRKAAWYLDRYINNLEERNVANSKSRNGDN